MLLTLVGALVVLVLLSSVMLWLKSRPQASGATSSAGSDSSWVFMDSGNASSGGDAGDCGQSDAAGADCGGSDGGAGGD